VSCDAQVFESLERAIELRAITVWKNAAVVVGFAGAAVEACRALAGTRQQYGGVAGELLLPGWGKVD
jgi:hypothetical protein